MNRFVSWGASTTYAEVFRALPSIEAAWHGRSAAEGGDGTFQGEAEEEAVAEGDDDEQARPRDLAVANPWHEHAWPSREHVRSDSARGCFPPGQLCLSSRKEAGCASSPWVRGSAGVVVQQDVATEAENQGHPVPFAAPQEPRCHSLPRRRLPRRAASRPPASPPTRPSSGSSSSCGGRAGSAASGSLPACVWGGAGWSPAGCFSGHPSTRPQSLACLRVGRAGLGSPLVALSTASAGFFVACS